MDRPLTYNPTPRRSLHSPNREPQFVPLAIIAAVFIIVVAVVIALVLPMCSKAQEEKNEPVAQGPAYEGPVTFVAVGDNLPSEYVGYYADKLAGKEDDGKYDYTPIFEPLRSYVQNADLAYVKEEVHIGGDEIGPKGYPSFNTTDEMADALIDIGFDFVASASNHAYDWGESGALEHSVALWQTKPVAFTGTSTTEEQYNRIAMVERKGIKFALLDYTYGVGGYEKSTLPPYAVHFIDESLIRSEVARAREEGADVVMVAMHWGTENLTEADDEQQRLAQLLADLDVDVVLGSHPHVIGPMAWVENSNGKGHRTLVAYSLGNFQSDHESPNSINLLEGMLTCTFEMKPVEEGSDEYAVAIEDVKWIPLVNHSSEDRSEFAVYALPDYTDELAKKNRVLKEEKDPIGWLKGKTDEIVGQEWL